jgi:hypothetical protein
MPRWYSGVYNSASRGSMIREASAMSGIEQGKQHVRAALVVGTMIVAAGLCDAQTVPSPGMIITASNITMASDGTGVIPFTLTSTNKFAGQVTVGCVAPTPAAGVREPACYAGGPMVAYTLSADGTAMGSITLTADAPLPSAAVARLEIPRQQNREGGGTVLAMAGALMMGWGLRRSCRRLASRAFAVAGLLVVVAGLSACGGPTTLTRGTYTYTLTAISLQEPSPIIPLGTEVSASTTVLVTVPPGIVVKYGVPVPV